MATIIVTILLTLYVCGIPISLFLEALMAPLGSHFGIIRLPFWKRIVRAVIWPVPVVLELVAILVKSFK